MQYHVNKDKSRPKKTFAKNNLYASIDLLKEEIDPKKRIGLTDN